MRTTRSPSVSSSSGSRDAPLASSSCAALSPTCSSERPASGCRGDASLVTGAGAGCSAWSASTSGTDGSAGVFGGSTRRGWGSGGGGSSTATAGGEVDSLVAFSDGRSTSVSPEDPRHDSAVIVVKRIAPIQFPPLTPTSRCSGSLHAASRRAPTASEEFPVPRRSRLSPETAWPDRGYPCARKMPAPAE